MTTTPIGKAQAALLRDNAPRYTNEAIQAAADRKGITFEQAREFLSGPLREVDCIRCGRAPGGPCPHDRPGTAVLLPVDCALAGEVRRAAAAEAAKHPPGALINTTDVPARPPTSCPYCNAPIAGWSDSGPA